MSERISAARRRVWELARAILNPEIGANRLVDITDIELITAE